MTSELEMQRLKNLKKKNFKISEKSVGMESWLSIKHFLKASKLSLRFKETAGILDLYSNRLLELVKEVRLKTQFNNFIWVISHVVAYCASCCTLTHCCFLSPRLLHSVLSFSVCSRAPALEIPI